MSSNDAPSVQRLGGGEQPVPGQVGGVEGLAAFLACAGIERVEFVADAVALANSRPCGSRPRSSAKSRNTTRIMTVTAAS